MENDANGGRQHNTAHALLISHAHSAAVVSRNMMNIAWERQDLSCMYLAHHELESGIMFIVIVIFVVIAIVIIVIMSLLLP